MINNALIIQWALMPRDILKQIFSRVSDEDLAFKVSLVCKSFLKIVNEESIWKERFSRLLKGNTILTAKLLKKNYRNWKIAYFIAKEMHLVEKLIPALRASMTDFEPQRKGKIKDGLLYGSGIMIYSNGELWKGIFNGDKLNDRGLILFPKGEFKVGNFKEDQLEGPGEMMNSDGTILEGIFKNSYLHGKGKETSPKGETWCGTFDNGQIVKEN